MSIRQCTMQGLALVFMYCGALLPAAAQETCETGDGHWGGGPPEAVEHWSNGSEHLLAVGEGTRLALYDSSVPSAPVRLGVVQVGDPVRNVEIAPDGLTAAVSDHRRRVHLIDIGNRAAPVRRGSNATTGTRQPYGMDIVGNRLYVAVRQLGLVVLDIGNLDAPVLLGQSSGAVTDYVFDVEVRGNYAYLAQRADGVRIINIANPAAPQVVGAHALSTGAADIDIVGNRAYVTRGNEGVDILDLTNATAPTRISTFATTTGSYLFDTELLGSTHAAVSSFAGTFVYSMATPAAPVLVSNIGMNHYWLATQGNIAFTSASTGNVPVVRILDFGMPVSPSEVGTLVFDGPSVDVRVGGGQILVANGQRGLAILDAGNPLAPVFAGRIEFADAYVGVVERVNGVAVAWAYPSLKVIDTSNPSMPVLLSSIGSKLVVVDLFASGTHLYAAVGSGVHLYDLANPTSPQTIWEWQPPTGVALRIAVDGNMAHVGLNQVLRVLQLANPAPPVEIDGYLMPSRITDIAAVNDFVYVATEISGISVLDNRIPGAMIEVATIDMGDAVPSGLAIAGDRLYIAANGNQGLIVHDISDPLVPQFVELRSTPGEPQRVAVGNGVVALADGSSGVRSYLCDAAAADRIFGNGFDPS